MRRALVVVSLCLANILLLAVPAPAEAVQPMVADPPVEDDSLATAGPFIVFVSAIAWAGGSYYVWLGRPEGWIESEDPNVKASIRGSTLVGRFFRGLGRLGVAAGLLLTVVGSLLKAT